jgi:mono/diheme cytochrome c family protein
VLTGSPPRGRLALAGAPFLAAIALAAAGCGSGGDPSTGGLAKNGSASGGKSLFVAKCGSCHTLQDAGTTGKVGPNLDDAFRGPRAQGFKDSTIKAVVRGQIALAEGTMPPNLVTGQDADDVAAYVASVAGKS